jgi:lipoyl(octanoyl) transferase
VSASPVVAAPAAIRKLGFAPLAHVFAEMQAFTAARDASTRDEIWFVEHAPVYTLGLRADRSHVLAPGASPVVATDRGGHVTYHGPGQLLAYVLNDLRRLAIHVRTLVEALEGAVVDTVAAYGVTAAGRRDAPGVYVDGRKLAALGLRVRRGCTYHGIAINVAMDLRPFRGINPCGHRGLEVTQLADLCGIREIERLREDFTPRLIARLYGG